MTGRCVQGDVSYLDIITLSDNLMTETKQKLYAQRYRGKGYNLNVVIADSAAAGRLAVLKEAYGSLRAAVEAAILNLPDPSASDVASTKRKVKP